MLFDSQIFEYMKISPQFLPQTIQGYILSRISRVINRFVTISNFTQELLIAAFADWLENLSRRNYLCSVRFVMLLNNGT
jgi:hypothetical protein